MCIRSLKGLSLTKSAIRDQPLKLLNGQTIQISRESPYEFELEQNRMAWAFAPVRTCAVSYAYISCKILLKCSFCRAAKLFAIQRRAITVMNSPINTNLSEVSHQRPHRYQRVYTQIIMKSGPLFDQWYEYLEYFMARLLRNWTKGNNKWIFCSRAQNHSARNRTCEGFSIGIKFASQSYASVVLRLFILHYSTKLVFSFFFSNDMVDSKYTLISSHILSSNVRLIRFKRWFVY